jgi:hypothetical protein
MYKITEDSVKKLAEIYNAFNRLEIRGISNFELAGIISVKLKEVLNELDKLNQEGG